MAVAMLYSAFAHAARLVPGAKPARLRWQVGRSILIWVAVFVCLASLVFVMKIGAVFSRGEMLLFFASGIAATAIVRRAVARICAFVISSGTLAPSQVVLVGSAEELALNQARPQLQRYGYVVSGSSCSHRPRRLRPSDSLREQLREVVRYVREKRVDEVILALPWNQPEVIQHVESELRMLPVPVKLVPDVVTSRVLMRPLFELGHKGRRDSARTPQRRAAIPEARHGSVSCRRRLFALIPFITVIAAAIRLESPGSAMFMQIRVGSMAAVPGSTSSGP